MNIPKRPEITVVHELMVNTAAIQKLINEAKTLMPTDTPADIREIVRTLTETVPTSIERLKIVFRHIYTGILGREPNGAEELTPAMLAARELFFACRKELPMVTATGNHTYPWRLPVSHSLKYA